MIECKCCKIWCCLCGAGEVKKSGGRCLDCNAMLSFYRRVSAMDNGERMALYHKHITIIQRIVNVMDHPKAGQIELSKIELKKRGVKSAN